MAANLIERLLRAALPASAPSLGHDHELTMALAAKKRAAEREFRNQGFSRKEALIRASQLFRGER